MWYKVNKRLIGTKQVRPSYEWKPDASRTLLYLPLESDTNDYSWNNRTCTPTSVTFTTVGWVQSAHVWTTGWIIVTPNGFVNTSLQYCTTSCLVYWTSAQTSNRRNLLEWKIQNTCSIGMCALENSTQLDAYWGVWNNPNTYVSDMVNKWTHIVMTIGNWVYKLYINWELKQNKTETYNYARWSRPYSYQQSQTVFNSRNWVSASQWLNWNAREIIFENIEWSADDVSKYYQRIKAKLWF